MKLLKGNRNQCGGCDEYFNSIGAFEKHRTGKHGVDRRCRTHEEMTAIGMSLNRDGFWIGEKMPEAVSQRKSQTTKEMGNVELSLDRIEVDAQDRHANTGCDA